MTTGESPDPADGIPPEEYFVPSGLGHEAGIIVLGSKDSPATLHDLDNLIWRRYEGGTLSTDDMLAAAAMVDQLKAALDQPSNTGLSLAEIISQTNGENGGNIVLLMSAPEPEEAPLLGTALKLLPEAKRDAYFAHVIPIENDVILTIAINDANNFTDQEVRDEIIVMELNGEISEAVSRYALAFLDGIKEAGLDTASFAFVDNEGLSYLSIVFPEDKLGEDDYGET